ncbi:MAG: DUF1846 family protein, partial [Erysipelotrichaceae bacterium]
DAAAIKASQEEIIRRYYQAKVDVKKGVATEDVVEKIELIMAQANATIEGRKCVAPALAKAEETSAPAMAIELPDGRIVTGKTSPLLGASSAALLNALKALCNVDDDLLLISPSIIEPIQQLKVNNLGNNNPRLHTDEVLIALSISATTNPISHMAMKALEKLKDCEAHSTVILSEVDRNMFRKLQVNLTTEPQYQTKKLYHH